MPYPTMNTPKYVPRANGGRLRDITKRIANSNAPSNKASYS
ncbi:unknown [Eggerthella sp. CAG:209]|nr:unknown [Eggerthella sp. CAG:209]